MKIKTIRIDQISAPEHHVECADCGADCANSDGTPWIYDHEAEMIMTCERPSCGQTWKLPKGKYPVTIFKRRHNRG